MNRTGTIILRSDLRPGDIGSIVRLHGAARLYRAAGFRKVEEKAGRQWSVEVVEERYDLDLRQHQHGGPHVGLHQ